MLDKDFYTVNEINKMLGNREICYFGEGYDETYMPVGALEIDSTVLRIFANNLDISIHTPARGVTLTKREALIYEDEQQC